MSTETRTPVSASTALTRLREGNERFVTNVRSIEVLARQAHQPHLASGQSPFAIVLSCSDSRAPSELLFDCGLGDLFVVRVAGNITAPSLVGSVEFAAATFATQLVVVMGHTRCGAVAATVDSLRLGGSALTENVQDIVQRIAPSLQELVSSWTGDRETLLARATRANVRAAVGQLRHGSKWIEQRVAEGKLSVVGAEYVLETGRVDFFDVPAELR